MPHKACLCEVYSEAQISSMNNKDLKIHEANSFDFLKHFQHLGTNLEPEQVEDKQKLLNWSHVFSQHNLDLGLIDKAVHKLHLKDDEPFKKRPGIFCHLCITKFGVT